MPSMRPMNVVEVDGPDNTYVASFTGLNVGLAATTDIVTLFGSATATIRVVQVVIAGTIAVAAAHVDVCLVTRSAVDTVGTPVALNVASQDPTDPATTATGLNSYTAGPVAGATLAQQGAQKLFLPVPGAALNNQVVWNFGLGAGAKALILRGTAQGLALTLNSATLANATSLTGYIIYTERPN